MIKRANLNIIYSKWISVGQTLLNQNISVESVDSLAELQAEEHAGSLSSSVSQRRTESSKDEKVTGLKDALKFEILRRKLALCIF